MSKRSAAIVGRAATAAFAPFDDPGWEIWGLAWVRYPRAELLFDIHTPDFKAHPPYDEHYNSHRNLSLSYFTNVNKSGVPVLCHPDAAGSAPNQFHNGTAFPYAEAEAICPQRYLDCTISYMIAYAMLQKLDRIGFWGCHFRGSLREAIQLPSVTYLIGLAEGRGMEVVIGPGSPMMASHYARGRYGIDQAQRWGGAA